MLLLASLFLLVSAVVSINLQLQVFMTFLIVLVVSAAVGPAVADVFGAVAVTWGGPSSYWRPCH